MMETLFGAESEDSDDEPETVRQAVSDQASDRSVSDFFFFSFLHNRFLTPFSERLSHCQGSPAFSTFRSRPHGREVITSTFAWDVLVHTAFIHTNTCANRPNLHTKMLSSNLSYALPYTLLIVCKGFEWILDALYKLYNLGFATKMVFYV